MDCGFWQRLKQRKLVQWALAYAAAAFAFVQVLDVVAQRFGWPDELEKLIILALVVGFFVVLVLAWYHGEKGRQRVSGTELLLIALVLAVGGGALWAYARRPYVAPGAVAVLAAPSVGATSGSEVPPTSRIPGKSVAVLPFTNDSGDVSQQYFSDGLSEDLINALSQFQGLKVISRNSAFQFRNTKESSAVIGQKLDVAHLLEGSVQRAENEVRVTATLVDAANGTVVWSQRYDKPYADLFQLQDAITAAVADALRTQLVSAPGAVLQSDRPPSGNLAAYDAYQRGVAAVRQTTKAGTLAAITVFSKAVRLDPGYAAAYARLSNAWTTLAAVDAAAPAGQAYAKAAAAAGVALTLDPDSAMAHAAHSFLLLMQMDWAGAADEAQAARRLAPLDVDVEGHAAYLLAIMGHVHEAVAAMRAVLRSDPTNSWSHIQIGGYLAAIGHLDEADASIHCAIVLQPGAEGFHEQLVTLDVVRGDAAAALTDAHAEPPGQWRTLAIALALQIGSDRAAADAALYRFIAAYGNSQPYAIAQMYAARRDPDNVFKWLDLAWSRHDATISELLWDPLTLRYRTDPRFAAFCKQVGLPATTDAVAMKL